MSLSAFQPVLGLSPARFGRLHRVAASPHANCVGRLFGWGSAVALLVVCVEGVRLLLPHTLWLMAGLLVRVIEHPFSPQTAGRHVSGAPPGAVGLVLCISGVVMRLDVAPRIIHSRSSSVSARIDLPVLCGRQLSYSSGGEAL